MILFDEFDRLIGIDSESLALFGFDNIEDFKRNSVDISNYFIKKEGYVYKFENFHWLDFVNFSEENIDKVLIKLDKNRAIEAKISIDELYPAVDIDNSKIIYIVKFQDKKEVNIEPRQTLLKEEQLSKKSEEELKKDKIEDEKIEPFAEDEIFTKLNIDFSTVKEELDISKTLYKELLRDFADESRDDFRLVGIFVEDGNYEKALKQIKKLKNISANLRVEGFLTLLDDMEKEIRENSGKNISEYITNFNNEIKILSNQV